jgi:four helix bundle protein
MGSFKDLGVWRESVQLAVVVYRITERFPSTERFGLTSQTRRAAVSISSNIAEGKGRGSGGEVCRFLDIAMGSLFEVQSQLEVAVALGFTDADTIQQTTELIDKLGRGLSNLKRSHARRC